MRDRGLTHERLDAAGRGYNRAVFVGHLAVALAAKPAAPRTSLGVLIAAAFALDLVWPMFVLAGVERVIVSPGSTAFTPLDFVHYPWSHSLLMAIVWGGLLALLGGREARGSAAILAAAVVSHWLLDFVTHRPDLPVWPGGPEVGLGLWHSIPATLAIEGAMLALALLVYCRFTDARNRVGRWGLWGLVGFTVLIWASGPFSPPPPGAAAVAVVALAMWLFPLWGHWVERNRAVRTAQSVR